nr:MAG TPA: hypothetical protein [Caudoviricetes sp.]
MIRLNAKTRKAQHFVGAWMRSNDVTLDDVYRNPSQRKRRAYASCFLRCVNTGKRETFRIIFHNSQTFTVAWRGYSPDCGDFGLFVETASYQFFIPYERGVFEP